MTVQDPSSAFDPEERAQRRTEPRLRLGIPAKFESLEGQHKVRLLDLSQSGAHVDMPDIGKVRQGVLTWMGYEVFAEVMWQKRSEIGVQFDTQLTYDQLVEIREYAPAVVQQEAIDAAKAARDFVDGRLHNGSER